MEKSKWTIQSSEKKGRVETLNFLRFWSHFPSLLWRNLVSSTASSQSLAQWFFYCYHWTYKLIWFGNCWHHRMMRFLDPRIQGISSTRFLAACSEKPWWLEVCTLNLMKFFPLYHLQLNQIAYNSCTSKYLAVISVIEGKINNVP